jgi:hypothetical protein
LCRDDVEVSVEVQGPRPLSRAPSHNARFVELACRRHFDQLGRQVELLHRVTQNPATTTEAAAGRILRIHCNEFFHQRGHLAGTRLQPAL